MTILNWDDFTKGALSGKDSISLSIGVFDGVHIGHRQLLSDILSQIGSTSVVLTFRVNPRVYFKDRTYPGDIYTLSQKLSVLSSLGIDTVILIDFSYDFSKLSGKDFLYFVADSCELRHLVLGDNFRCGNGRVTTSYEAVEILKHKNVTVDIGNMAFCEGQLVSSSRVRSAVASGKLQEVQKMLERVFSLDIADIPQISGDKTITIETKNISQVLPPQGQYTVLTGTADTTLKSKILIGASDIRVPLQNLQHLDFIKFI
jgi:riboflavin kinase/FMN adenylyltransferase